jgi:L-ascorbate metabolism protein UlaG (beta-lactamase superfamily)
MMISERKASNDSRSVRQLEDLMKKRSLFTLTVACFVAAAAGGAGDSSIATDDGPVTIHPLEHATFVMQWSGNIVAVDPIGGAPRFESFGKANLVLVTDIHGDHLSVDTVLGVAKPSAMIVAPKAVAEKFPESDRERITVVANGETVKWGESTVEAVPMYNLTEERQRFHPKGRGNGYVVTLGGTRIYIAGDTEDIPEMRALKDIDAAFVCMNLPYTMDVEAAADAVLEFEPKVVIPYHYRGEGGMSDLEEFRSLVAKDPKIEVRLLEWY